MRKSYGKDLKKKKKKKKKKKRNFREKVLSKIIKKKIFLNYSKYNRAVTISNGLETSISRTKSGNELGTSFKSPKTLRGRPEKLLITFWTS